MHAHDLDNQQGAALLTTIIVLVLLTIIGVAGINTTSTDLEISSNYRDANQQFYQADGHLNLVFQDTSSWLNSTSDLLNDPNATYSFDRDFDSDGHSETNTTVTGITLNSTDGLPEMQHQSAPPIGSGYGANKFEIRRYALVTNHTESATQLESGGFRVFPK